MDYSMILTHGLRNRCADSFVTNFASIGIPNKSQWVSFCFNVNKSEGHIAAIGNEYGEVSFLDTRFLLDENPQRKFCIGVNHSSIWKSGIQAHKNAVMDLCFVPGYPRTLSTISGCAEVAIFDLEKVQKIAFSSHQKSVRAISFFPEQSNYFVTGGRDGHIFVWDLRVLGSTHKNPCHDQITIVTKPHGTILNAHLSRDSTNHRRSTYVAEEVNGITSLAHLDEFSVASSSAKSKTGIYIWDIRYQKPEKPLRILHIPPGTSQKQTGISSLSVDRFGSQLFAICTDNRILVYEAQSNCNNPVNTLRTPINNTFQVQCAASPISDHLLCGSSNNAAYIYDLQECHNSMQDVLLAYEKPQKVLPSPKYRLGGHKGEVGVVSWSCDGRYMATLDDNDLRIWDRFIDVNINEKLIHDQPIKFVRPEILEYTPSETSHPIKHKTCHNLGFLHEHALTTRIVSPIKLKNLSTALTFRSSRISTSPTKLIKSPLKKRLKLETSPVSPVSSSRKNLSNVFVMLAKDGQENVQPYSPARSITKTPKSKTTPRRKSNKRLRSRESTPGPPSYDQKRTPSNKTILDYFSPKSSV